MPEDSSESCFLVASYPLKTRLKSRKDMWLLVNQSTGHLPILSPFLGGISPIKSPRLMADVMS